MTHDDDRDLRLTRLLEGAGPGSVPKLEPDPHLPTRIRAMARESGGGLAAHRPRRWVPVSLGAAALVIAVTIGSYIGYSAGAAQASATESEQTETVATLWTAWSQTGFADDLQSLATTDSEVQP